MHPRPLVEGDFGYGCNGFRQRPAQHPRSSGCDPWFNLSQYLYQTDHVGLFEHAFDTIAVEISEGSLIQQRRVHHAARGEVIDNEVQEFELIRSEPAAVEEFSEGPLGRFPVETHKSADETREPAVGQRPERRFINARLKENTL